MKCGLISPKGTIFFESDEFLSFWQDIKEVKYYKNAWSGLGTALSVVAALTPNSFQIKIIDENFEKINFNEEFDIVGVTAMTQQATRAYEIADKFREKGAYIVMGGIHPTILPYEAKLHADSVIVGEAETLWPSFIDDFLKGRQRPFYRENNPKGFELSKSPIPRYDLLNSNYYNTIWPQTTRGCPHNCDFCVASNIYGLRFRHKTNKQIIEELNFIKEIWENPTLCFADDNMFVNKSFAKKLVKEFIPLELTWMAQTDISVGEDEELLKLLFKSGCQTLYIGFESISEKNLYSLDPYNWKFKQLRNYPKLIERIQSHGIGIHASLMVGFDYDDPNTFQNIIDFVVNNNLLGGSISILAPYPGSKLRKRLKKEGRLLKKKWNKYNGGNVTFIPKNMTAQELQEGFFRIWREIYAPEIQTQKRQYFKNIFKKLYLEKSKQHTPQNNRGIVKEIKI